MNGAFIQEVKHDPLMYSLNENKPGTSSELLERAQTYADSNEFGASDVKEEIEP